MRASYFSIVALAVTVSAMPPLQSQDDVAKSMSVLAKVGDMPITYADVDLALGRSGNVQGKLSDVPESIVWATVDIIARQRQAMEALRKSKKRISDSEIEKWLLANSPSDLKLTANQALSARAEAARVTKKNYREFLAFRMSWQVYLQNTMKDANLEKHFANQKARFDGTRFQIEHLALAAPPGTSKTRDSARERMKKIADKISGGELDFKSATAELAQEKSTQDDAKKSADPIWLTGGGPLMPTVIDWVMKTPVGKMSEPFDSSQAVHLVRVIAIEQGKGTYDQAKEEVRKHMLLFLLNYLADQSAKSLPLVWVE